MEKIVLVWHGHHQESSPLEDLQESFKDRKETIVYTKSRMKTRPKLLVVRSFSSILKAASKRCLVLFRELMPVT